MIRLRIDTLVQDLRYALRRLGRDRGFTAAAVLILTAASAPAPRCSASSMRCCSGRSRSPTPDADRDAVVRGHPASGGGRAAVLGAPQSARPASVARGHRPGGLGQLGRRVADSRCPAGGTGEQCGSGTFFDVLGASARLGRTFTRTRRRAVRRAGDGAEPRGVDTVFRRRSGRGRPQGADGRRPNRRSSSRSSGSCRLNFSFRAARNTGRRRRAELGDCRRVW